MSRLGRVSTSVRDAVGGALVLAGYWITGGRRMVTDVGRLLDLGIEADNHQREAQAAMAAAVQPHGSYWPPAIVTPDHG